MCLCAKPHNAEWAISQFSAGQHIQPGPKVCLDMCANFLQRIKQIMDQNNRSVHCSNRKRLQPPARDWCSFPRSRYQQSRKHFSPVAERYTAIIYSLIGYRCSANVFMGTSQVGFAFNLPDFNFYNVGLYLPKAVRGVRNGQSNTVAGAPFRLFPVEPDSTADFVLWDSQMSRRVVSAPEKKKATVPRQGCPHFINGRCVWYVPSIRQTKGSLG